MSKVKCNKCGADIKIKTIFLENAGCECCGNRIEFTTMDELSGLKQGLMLGTSVFIGIVGIIAMLVTGVKFTELPTLFMNLSLQNMGLLVIAALIVTLVVGTLERVIGCSIYEKWRKREEELEEISQKKRMEDSENKQ